MTQYNADQRRNGYILRKARTNNACSAVANAIESGLLVPRSCESCGQENTQAHHDDYNHPLAVRWLCKTCHTAWHRANTPVYVDGWQRAVVENPDVLRVLAERASRRRAPITNNPDGRPKTSPDGMPRTIFVHVMLSPLEAEILDTRRGEESRAEHLRRKALAGDGEKEPT